MGGGLEQQRFTVAGVLLGGAQQTLGFGEVGGRRVGAHAVHRTAVCPWRVGGVALVVPGVRDWGGRGRERVPVVVQGRSGRRGLVRVLWFGAETVVTCGVLILLLVAHQVWWTNRPARAEAGEQVAVLEREWEGEWGISPSEGSSPSRLPCPLLPGRAAGVAVPVRLLLPPPLLFP
ncbi:hypothetical protein GCM10010282_13200 [Streptomyces roseolus]|nr:hypothetical protein GCM10010282_13200 [Streptomyces roseolus]